MQEDDARTVSVNLGCSCSRTVFFSLFTQLDQDKSHVSVKVPPTVGRLTCVDLHRTTVHLCFGRWQLSDSPSPSPLFAVDSEVGLFDIYGSGRFRRR